MSSVDSIVNNGAYIITNLDDNPYGKNYTSILYVTKTMEGNSPYIRQVAVRNQYGVDSCKIRWYWGDSWTAWKDNAIDYPTFYKSYSDLSSLATALGGQNRIIRVRKEGGFFDLCDVYIEGTTAYFQKEDGAVFHIDGIVVD